MVDEREDQYDGEEGEYHFSDDQQNYEDLEMPKPGQSTLSIKKTILDKLSGLTLKRRMVVAGVVFVLLIGVVYKMLLPSSTSLPADFAQEAAIKTNQPSTTAVKQSIASTSAPSAAPATSLAAIPSERPAPMQQPAAQDMNPPRLEQVTSNPPALPVAGQSMSAASPANYTAAPAVTTAPVAVSPDRLKAVEDQNAGMMNLLQTEYAQKMSDFEMQSNLVRSKMDEMSKRITRIEASLNQVTQLLQQQGGVTNKTQPTAMTAAQPMSEGRFAVPKVAYTVQAIIPGRAWLKSDSGDTVTVAEGDTLRDYGRISKIDPYDGVVEIDTGNKVIALSYGMSVE